MKFSKKGPVVKKARAARAPKAEDLTQEYPSRLAELEAELFAKVAEGGKRASLNSVKKIAKDEIDGVPVMRFDFKGTSYATGHTDTTFADANHARGVRHIHFYDDKNTIVLGIEGNFQTQAYGANFEFRRLKTYVPGEWEPFFLAMTDELRTYRADRKEEFRRLRG
jgi:hypothetical protein